MASGLSFLTLLSLVSIPSVLACVAGGASRPVTGRTVWM